MLLNSSTVAAAIANIERYVHVHNNGVWTFFTREGDKARLQYLFDDVAQTWRRQHNEYSMAVLVGTFRVLLGSRWTPREIHFAHEAPVLTGEHARIFGCRVIFASAANALVLEHDFIERAVPVADEKLYRLLKRNVERMLRDTPRRDDWPGGRHPGDQ